MGFVPSLHRLHRRFAFQCRLRELVVVQRHIAQQGLLQIFSRVKAVRVQHIGRKAVPRKSVPGLKSEPLFHIAQISSCLAFARFRLTNRLNLQQQSVQGWRPISGYSQYEGVGSARFAACAVDAALAQRLLQFKPAFTVGAQVST